MTVLVEPMREQDLLAVAAIAGATGLPVVRLREEAARAWSRVWVARDPEVVGFLLAWHVADELHVLDVATREDRRRRGVGRTLVQAAIAYAHAHQVRRLFLEARRSNEPAIALYRSAGFRELGARAHYYEDGEDALEMMLALELDG
jgi:ribosomal-protein-alanine N-acetyltransferase